MEEPTLAQEIINKILEYSDLNANQFAEKLGYKRAQVIYDILKGETKNLTPKVVGKILSVFPELNKAWIMTGEGDMTISPVRQKNVNGDNINGENVTINENQTQEFMQVLIKSQQQLDRSQDQIDKLLDRLAKKDEQMDVLLNSKK